MTHRPTCTRRQVLLGGVGVVVVAACGGDDSETAPTGTGGSGGAAGGSGGSGGSGEGGAGGAGPDPGPWKLAEGHFIPAKLPLTIISPRPADEIGADSSYRWAHEEVRYQMPIGVLGGAWPFRFELIEGPPGMTIGAQLQPDGDHLVRPPDYGVVTWTPPAGSEGQSLSYRVRVLDQEDNEATVTVELTVSASKFLFVAPDDGSPQGSGTIDAPLRGFAAMFEGLSAAATYAGRHVYFRGGNYLLEGGSDTNGNARIGGGGKPKVWRAFPDEEPVFDCSTAKVIFNGGEMDDCCFTGIRWEHGRQDVANAHFIWATTQFDRGLFWRNTFFDLQMGTTGNDNPAAIFFSAAGGHRQYLAVLSNAFVEMGPGGGNGVAGYDSYGQDYALFEDNEARDCTSTYCLWLKGGHRWTTVRGERAVVGNDTGTVLLNIMLGRDGGTERSEQVEVSYCAATTPSGHALRFHWATTADQNGPVWIYRCTVAGDVGALHTDTADVTLERCLFTDADPPTGATTVYADMVTVTDGDLDAGLELVGDARTSYLGTHGVEIA